MDDNLYALNIEVTGNLLNVICHSQVVVLELQYCFKTISNGLKEGVGRVTNVKELTTNQLLAVFVPVNKSWNRATLVQVISHVNIIVKLIDFGEIINTTVDNVRLLDVYFGQCSNVQIQEQIQALKHQPAFECLLHGVISISPWNDETKGKILSILGSPNTVQILYNILNKKIVKVFVNDTDIKDILITHNLVEEVEDEEFFSYCLMSNEQVNVYAPSQLKVNMGPNIAPQNFIEGLPPVLSPEISTMARNSSPLRTAPSVQHVSSPTQFTYETLIVGEVLEAYVSMVIDGPSLFAVQLKRNETVLSQLKQRINDRSYTLEPNTDVLEVGSICLGRSSVDSALRRALVSCVQKSGVLLYFVDFGNEEFVKFNNIYRMPTEFMRPKAMAIRVSLSKLKQNLYSAESLQLFADRTLNKTVLIKVNKSEESFLNCVELFLVENNEYINVNKIMQKFPRYEQIDLPHRGKQIPGLVSHVESFSKFYIRYESHENGLNRMMECLKNYCTTADPDANLLTTDLAENMPVSCLNNHDKRWYRCSILNAHNDPEDIKVFYVDYGIMDSVSIESLLKIKEEYVVKFRSQALQCCLDGNLEEFSDDESIKFFSGFVKNKVFTVKVISILPDNVLLVQMLNENGNDILNEFRSLITKASEQLTTTKTVTDNASPIYGILDKEAELVANAAQKCGVLPHLEEVTPSQQQQKNNDQSTSSYDSKYDSNKETPKPYRKREDNYNFKGGPNRHYSSYKGGFDRSSNGFDHKKSSEDNASKSFGWRDNDGGRNDEDNSYRRRSNADLNNRVQMPDGYSDYCGRINVRKSSSDYETRFKNNDEGRIRNLRNDQCQWSNKQCTEDVPVNQLSGRGKDKAAESERKPWNKPYDKKNEDRFNNRSATNDRFGNRSNGRFYNKNDSIDSNCGRDSNDRFRNRNDNNDHFNNANRFRNQNDNNRYRSNYKRGNSNDSNDPVFGNKKPYVKRGFNDRGDSFRNQYTLLAPKLLEGFAKTGEYVLPEYTIGSTANVIISWFVNPQSFFSQTINPEFRLLMERMQEFYIKINPSDNIELGDRVVARYPADRVIYRAIVQAVNFSDVTVKFVDYGNVGTCKKNSVWTINPDHCAIPIQAIHCGLHDITPPDGLAKWNDSKMVDWSNYFLKDSYTLSIVQSSIDDKNETFYKITLKNENNQSVSDQLVNSGLASKPTIVQTSVELPVDMPLLVGQTIPVHVSHVVSSRKFFVHIEPSKADKIRTIIESAIAENQMVNIPPRQLTKRVFCLVKGVDENPWYRARTLSFDSVGNTVDIVYVDFGSEDTVPIERIYFLPDQLTQYSSQAVECSLYGISKLMPEELENFFIKLVYLNDFTARIDELADYRCIVTLFHVDGKHIQLPTSSDQTAEPLLPMPVLRHRGTFFVFSVSIENGQLQAFIQHACDATELRSMQDNLFTVYDTSVPPAEKDSIQIGTICAAKSILYDNWYRAKVISIEDTGYVVYYVDYGGIPEKLQIENLRLLDAKYCYPPEFSLKVSVGISVSEDCDLDAVFTAVCGRQYTVELDKYENGWFADMTDLNGKNFADICIEQGFGSKIDIVIKRHVKNRLREWFHDEKLKITNYVSPDEFWIQLDKDAEMISRIQYDIQKIADNVPSIVGGCSTEKYFAALNPKDQLWYRCFYENEETVRSIDFGFTISDVVGGIKILPRYITRETPFAIMCNLDLESKNENNDGGGGEWDAKTRNYFEGSSVIGNILLRQSLNQAIIDLNINGLNIRELLFAKNLCKRKSHEVSISHFNSFDDFYIQIFSNDLINFANKIQICENLLPIVPKINELVAAKSIDDGLWYRACVKSLKNVDSPSTYKVQFVDYGNMVDSMKFRFLPQDILETPYFAIKCELDSKGQNLRKFEDSFLEFLNDAIDGHFKINFEKFTPIVSVTMTYSGEDIIKLLKQSQGVWELEFGSYLNVVLSYVDSPKNFYVQKSDTDLTEIEQALSTVENSKPLLDAKENQLVAAVFEDDGLWYRGKIKKILPENHCDVFFIDYGNSLITGNLRELPTSIKKIPPVAYHCSLFLPSDLSEWPDDVNSKLVSFCSEACELNMLVVKIGTPIMVSLIHNGVDFIQEIVTSLNQGKVTVQDTEKFEHKCDVFNMAEFQDSKLTKEHEDVSETFIEEFSTAKNSDIFSESIENFSETVEDIQPSINVNIKNISEILMNKEIEKPEHISQILAKEDSKVEEVDGEIEISEIWDETLVGDAIDKDSSYESAVTGDAIDKDSSYESTVTSFSRKSEDFSEDDNENQTA